MVPSSAVTTALMAFAPTESAMAPLAEPLVTAVRLVPTPTFTVAPELVTVGVSFTWVTELATDAV